MKESNKKLLDKAKDLPHSPGCYLMRQNGRVIYVGKAKDLKSRVSSYFLESAKTPKTEILVSHIDEFEFVLAKSETEALILENTLIKKLKPKYNIRLRDDKSYPYVQVDLSKDFPRLEYVRKVKRSKEKKIFGPFVHGSNISEVLRVITKLFGLRDCSDREMNCRKEPCLLYQMKQCLAPCVYKVTKEEYQLNLELALSFFRSSPEIALNFLKDKMEQFSNNEEFEQAIIYRDSIAILEEFVTFFANRALDLKEGKESLDLISYYQGEREIDIALYIVRNGILYGHKNFNFLRFDLDEDVKKEVISFVIQYYFRSSESFPDSLVIDLPKELTGKIEEVFKEEKIPIKLSHLVPKYDSLMRLVWENAKEHQRVRLSNEDSVYVGLKQLQEILKLKQRPQVLECFDVAVFQGSSPTASQVVFEDGVAKKDSYRYYHLKERPEGNNDFAMMEEMISRRLKHGDYPDVFIVDGGKGQVSSFLKILSENDVEIPVVGIAKEKVKRTLSSFKDKNIEKSEERLVVPGRGNSISLSKKIALFRILTSMRDEAHRFCRKLHHKKENTRVISSSLDGIPGIGPKLKIKILSQLTFPLSELKGMPVYQIMEKLKVSIRVAKILKKTFD